MGKSLDHRVEAHSPNEVTALVSFPSCLEWKICPFWFLNSEKLKVIFWYSYSSWNLVSFNLLSSNNLLFIMFKIVPVVWINVGFLLLKGRALFRAPAEQAASCLVISVGQKLCQERWRSSATQGTWWLRWMCLVEMSVTPVGLSLIPLRVSVRQTEKQHEEGWFALSAHMS